MQLIRGGARIISDENRRASSRAAARVRHQAAVSSMVPLHPDAVVPLCGLVYSRNQVDIWRLYEEIVNCWTGFYAVPGCNFCFRAGEPFFARRNGDEDQVANYPGDVHQQ